MDTTEIPKKPSEAILSRLAELFDAGWMYPDPKKVEAEWAKKAYELIVEEATSLKKPHVAAMEIQVPATLMGNTTSAEPRKAWVVKVWTREGYYADAPGFASQLFEAGHTATMLAKELGRVYNLPSFTLGRMKEHDIVSR